MPRGVKRCQKAWKTGPFCVSMSASGRCRSSRRCCHGMSRIGTEAHAAFPTLFPIPQLALAGFYEVRFWGVWLAGSTVPGVRGLPSRFARDQGRAGCRRTCLSRLFVAVPWCPTRVPATDFGRLTFSWCPGWGCGAVSRCPGAGTFSSWSPSARSRRPAERAGGYWERGCGRHCRPPF